MDVLRPRQPTTTTCRRSSSCPTRAATRPAVRTTGRPASCPPRIKASPSGRPATRSPTSHAEGRVPGRASGRRRPARRTWTGTTPPTPGDGWLAARVRSYELAGRMQVSIPEVADLSKETQRTKRPLRPGRQGERRASAATACWPGGCSRTACASCSCSTAARSARRASTGTPTRTSSSNHTQAGGRPRQARRGPAQGPEAARHARRHAGPVDDGVRPDAVHAGDRQEGRDHHQLRFTCWHGRGRAEAGVRLTASRTRSATRWPADGVSVYDFHATVLHLLGLDHKQLTYYHNGTSGG